MKNINEYNYSNKRVLLRLDLNVPVTNNIILDYSRIDRIIPSIQYLLKQKAKIVIISHFGRPKSGFESKYSIEFLAKELSSKLAVPVSFCKETIGKETENLTNNMLPGEVLLLENLRFHPEEIRNDAAFASSLAKLADFYINDAFSCCHRAHSSIAKITEFLPSAAGLLLMEEIDNLSKHLLPGKKPIMAIVGGSKVSTKLNLLQNLVKQVDYLVIGGAMANTFLKAQGAEIGTSLFEEDMLDTAITILHTKQCKVILPQDVVIADKIEENSLNSVVNIKNIPSNKMILDIGPDTSSNICQLLKNCHTVIMNGPLGVFEFFPFSVGTLTIAREIAKLTREKRLVSIAGGGDIVAALSKGGLFPQFTYVSTAGGAFLEWLEGKKLPGIEALEKRGNI